MRVHQWQQFTGGLIIFECFRTSVFDGKNPGRPIKIDEKITESLKEIVTNERKITTRELRARTNVSQGIVICWDIPLLTSPIKERCPIKSSSAFIYSMIADGFSLMI